MSKINEEIKKRGIKKLPFSNLLDISKSIKQNALKHANKT